MKKPIDYLIEQYGCKDLEDLEKCFLSPDDVSITMLTEAIELAQKEAYNEGVEDSVQNAKVYFRPHGYGYDIDKESILKLKKK